MSVDALFTRIKRRDIPTCINRILSIPEESIDARLYADIWTQELGTGKERLRPVQGEALEVIHRYKCMLGLIGVGQGKTLISLMAGTAAGAERPLLLCPPSLVDQMQADADKWGESFDFIAPKILSYGKLSVASGARSIEEYSPDLIIADECHYLRKFDSARTKRFMRYFHNNPTTGFVGLSGTITNSTLKDYAHLLELALRSRAPVPLSRNELDVWSMCMDPKGEATVADYEKMWPLVNSNFPPNAMKDNDRKEMVRKGYQKRLRSIPGVVCTQQSACDASLHINAIELPVSLKAQVTLTRLYSTWTRPDGEELSTAAQVAQTARNLSSGFYYKWVWPRGRVNWEWMEARAEWNKAVRYRLQYHSKPGLDSPALIQELVENGGGGSALRYAWAKWAPLRHLHAPPKRAMWVDFYVVDYAEKWLKENPKGIVWYQSRAMADALRMRGINVFGEGSPAPRGGACAASIRVHGTGKNLQMYNTALVLEGPANGAAWEQLIGRLHRPGQGSDLVDFYVLQHTKPVRDALSRAREEALYIEHSIGNVQKLNIARYLGV